MDKIAVRTGLWASIISLLSILVWFVSFTVIATQGPLFFWTNPEDYFIYVREYPQFFQELAKFFMLVFSISYLILHLALVEDEAIRKRFAAKIGIIFMAMFTLLSGIHYFIQVTSVRLSTINGQTDGLEHFLQANPISASTAIDMLGWTIMLGLASLFIGLSFQQNRNAKWFQIFQFINAFFCLAALVGYLFQYDPLTFISINLGVGGIITIISIKAMLHFLKKRNALIKDNH